MMSWIGRSLFGWRISLVRGIPVLALSNFLPPVTAGIFGWLWLGVVGENGYRGELDR